MDDSIALRGLTPLLRYQEGRAALEILAKLKNRGKGCATVLHDVVLRRRYQWRPAVQASAGGSAIFSFYRTRDGSNMGILSKALLVFAATTLKVVVAVGSVASGVSIGVVAAAAAIQSTRLRSISYSKN